ncbi:MAG: alpha-hydroxy-acid oxidizing protein [Anaerolineaceae bacterium]|nr:alpha-hydroxy-acid oxidizing protein [Anaerolineaceae bacterium]
MDTSKLLNLREFEPLAREQLSQMIFEYYASGANDDVTLSANQSAYQRILLRPHMMTGNAQRSMKTTVIGQPMNIPILIAPMAYMKMAHPDGEYAMARAALSHSISMIVSTTATVALEDVAAAVPNAANWFQLYLYKDRAAARALVERAESCGYKAIVLTVDRPVLGRREADIRNNFALPSNMEIKNFPAEANREGVSAYHAPIFEDNLRWSDVSWLKSITRLPVLVKGVLRGDDARLAIERGADGIIVSNHGGRQLDGALATIDALPDVVQAVDGVVDVLIDGGIRRGTDVLKALARGAKAVLLGRSLLWGLALNGETGVGHVLDLITQELDLAMALCGCHSIADITPDLLADEKKIFQNSV